MQDVNLYNAVTFERDALRKIQRIASEGLAWIDVRSEPMERYNDAIQRAIQVVPVWTESCNTYYRSPSGRVVTQWPHSMSTFGRQVETVDGDAYEDAPL